MPTPTHDGDAALAARLDRLEAVIEIQRLVADYCHGADKRDADRFLSVWHPDGVWDVGGPVFTGAEQIRQAVARQWEVFGQMHHWTTNLAVDVDGDVAHGTCDASALTHLTDGTWRLTAGSYHDRYERRDGRWRIAHRRAVVHGGAALTPPRAGTGETPE